MDINFRSRVQTVLANLQVSYDWVEVRAAWHPDGGEGEDCTGEHYHIGCWTLYVTKFLNPKKPKEFVEFVDGEVYLMQPTDNPDDVLEHFAQKHMECLRIVEEMTEEECMKKISAPKPKSGLEAVLELLNNAQG